VLNNGLSEPSVVLLIGGLPRLAMPERGIRLRHLGQAPQYEVKLDRHRLFAPQCPVGVEGRDTLFKRHAARHRLLDEL